MSNSVSFVWECDRCFKTQVGDFDSKAASQPLPVQWVALDISSHEHKELCRECSDALNHFLMGQATEAVPLA